MLVFGGFEPGVYPYYFAERVKPLAHTSVLRGRRYQSRKRHYLLQQVAGLQGKLEASRNPGVSIEMYRSSNNRGHESLCDSGNPDQ